MLAGERLAQFEIRKKLGAGGMGEVFLAHDEKLDRQVALKFLPSEIESDELQKKRFLRGAKAAAALDHPYICHVHEVGEIDGRTFIAMEHVDGETLEAHIDSGPMPAEEARHVAIEIAEALQTAHRAGIVHRDLKPSNIMLTGDDHVKVLDFGLAKRLSPVGAESHAVTATKLTHEGTAPGTLTYMAPEQLRGESSDTRADIFSFGIVLYELLSGRHPFERANDVDTASAILDAEPAPLSGVSDAIQQVVRRALAKDPDQRYQTPEEVREALTNITPHTPRRAGRWQWAGAAAAAALLLTLLAVSLIPSTPLSVAVLPLDNQSLDPEGSDYLAEGISRAVITRLTRAGLRVTPWETVRRFAESENTPDAIAEELGVGAVLLGTFALADDRIHTTLYLVEAESGLQSWAEEYDEPYEDLFVVQRRIAEGAATSLNRSLSGEELEALAEPESVNVDAYDLYLQGAHLLQERDPESTEIAFQYFQRAVALDETMADAHVGLGAVHSDRYFYGWDGLESLQASVSSFERALALEPESMRARRGLIVAQFFLGHIEANLVQGREAARNGREDDVETLMARAQAYQLGATTKRALPLYRRAVELDPANPEPLWRLVSATWGHDSEGAVVAANDFLGRFGDDPEIHTYLGQAHLHLGNLTEARHHFDQADLESNPVPEAIYFGGLTYDRLGEADRAAELWRLGVNLAEAQLGDASDNARLRLFLASFYGLLGDEEAFRAEEERALAPKVSPWEIHFLAAVHSKNGNDRRAVELLQSSLERGLVYPSWRYVYPMAGIPFPESPEFAAFVASYEAEERRLGEVY